MGAGERELYVYAVSEPGLPPRFRLHGRSIVTLTVGKLQVVAERRSHRQDPTIEDLQEQHAIVVQLAQESQALLPARFGSLMTEQLLRDKIVRHESELLQGLDLVRGRQQMAVRVFGASDPIEPAVSRAVTGTAFLEARRERARRVPAEVETIHRMLGVFTAAERVQTGEGGLRVTVLHLVPRDVVDEYRQVASSLQPMLAPHKVTVTGPWPAFGFVPDVLSSPGPDT